MNILVDGWTSKVGALPTCHIAMAVPGRMGSQLVDSIEGKLEICALGAAPASQRGPLTTGMRSAKHFAAKKVHMMHGQPWTPGIRRYFARTPCSWLVDEACLISRQLFCSLPPADYFRHGLMVACPRAQNPYLNTQAAGMVH